MNSVVCNHPLGVAGVDLDRVLAVELDDWRGNSRCWPGRAFPLPTDTAALIGGPYLDSPQPRTGSDLSEVT